MGTKQAYSMFTWNNKYKRGQFLKRLKYTVRL